MLEISSSVGFLHFTKIDVCKYMHEHYNLQNWQKKEWFILNIHNLVLKIQSRTPIDPKLTLNFSWCKSWKSGCASQVKSAVGNLEKTYKLPFKPYSCCGWKVSRTLRERGVLPPPLFICILLTKQISINEHSLSRL